MPTEPTIPAPRRSFVGGVMSKLIGHNTHEVNSDNIEVSFYKIPDKIANKTYEKTSDKEVVVTDPRAHFKNLDSAARESKRFTPNSNSTKLTSRPTSVDLAADFSTLSNTPSISSKSPASLTSRSLTATSSRKESIAFDPPESGNNPRSRTSSNASSTDPAIAARNLSRRSVSHAKYMMSQAASGAYSGLRRSFVEPANANSSIQSVVQDRPSLSDRDTEVSTPMSANYAHNVTSTSSSASDSDPPPSARRLSSATVSTASFSKARNTFGTVSARYSPGYGATAGSLPSSRSNPSTATLMNTISRPTQASLRTTPVLRPVPASDVTPTASSECSAPDTVPTVNQARALFSAMASKSDAVPVAPSWSGTGPKTSRVDPPAGSNMARTTAAAQRKAELTAAHSDKHGLRTSSRARGSTIIPAGDTGTAAPASQPLETATADAKAVGSVALKAVNGSKPNKGSATVAASNTATGANSATQAAPTSATPKTTSSRAIVTSALTVTVNTNANATANATATSTSGETALDASAVASATTSSVNLEAATAAAIPAKSSAPPATSVSAQPSMYAPKVSITVTKPSTSSKLAISPADTSDASNTPASSLSYKAKSMPNLSAASPAEVPHNRASAKVDSTVLATAQGHDQGPPTGEVSVRRSGRFDVSFLSSTREQTDTVELNTSRTAQAQQSSSDLASMAGSGAVSRIRGSLVIPVDQLRFNELMERGDGSALDSADDLQGRTAQRRSSVRKSISLLGAQLPIVSAPNTPAGIRQRGLSDVPGYSASYSAGDPSPAMSSPQKPRPQSVQGRSRRLSAVHHLAPSEDALAETHADRAVIPQGKRASTRTTRAFVPDTELTALVHPIPVLSTPPASTPTPPASTPTPRAMAALRIDATESKSSKSEISAVPRNAAPDFERKESGSSKSSNLNVPPKAHQVESTAEEIQRAYSPIHPRISNSPTLSHKPVANTALSDNTALSESLTRQHSSHFIQQRHLSGSPTRPLSTASSAAASSVDTSTIGESDPGSGGLFEAFFGSGASTPAHLPAPKDSPAEATDLASIYLLPESRSDKVNWSEAVDTLVTGLPTAVLQQSKHVSVRRTSLTGSGSSTASSAVNRSLAEITTPSSLPGHSQLKTQSSGRRKSFIQLAQGAFGGHNSREKEGNAASGEESTYDWWPKDRQPSPTRLSAAAAAGVASHYEHESPSVGLPPSSPTIRGRNNSLVASLCRPQSGYTSPASSGLQKSDSSKSGFGWLFGAGKSSTTPVGSQKMSRGESDTAASSVGRPSTESTTGEGESGGPLSPAEKNHEFFRKLKEAKDFRTVEDHRSLTRADQRRLQAAEQAESERVRMKSTHFKRLGQPKGNPLISGRPQSALDGRASEAVLFRPSEAGDRVPHAYRTQSVNITKLNNALVGPPGLVPQGRERAVSSAKPQPGFLAPPRAALPSEAPSIAVAASSAPLVGPPGLVPLGRERAVSAAKPQSSPPRRPSVTAANTPSATPVSATNRPVSTKRNEMVATPAERQTPAFAPPPFEAAPARSIVSAPFGGSSGGRGSSLPVAPRKPVNTTSGTSTTERRKSIKLVPPSAPAAAPVTPAIPSSSVGHTLSSSRLHPAGSAVVDEGLNHSSATLMNSSGQPAFIAKHATQSLQVQSSPHSASSSSAAFGSVGSSGHRSLKTSKNVNTSAVIGAAAFGSSGSSGHQSFKTSKNVNNSTTASPAQSPHSSNVTTVTGSKSPYSISGSRIGPVLSPSRASLARRPSGVAPIEVTKGKDLVGRSRQLIEESMRLCGGQAPSREKILQALLHLETARGVLDEAGRLPMPAPGGEEEIEAIARLRLIDVSRTQLKQLQSSLLRMLEPL